MIAENASEASTATRRGWRRRGQLKWETFGSPSRAWRSPDGIEHVRGQPSQGVVTGEMIARASNVFNSDLDSRGHGIVFGTYVFEAASVSWRGHFNGTSTAEGTDVTWDGYALGQRLWGTFKQVGTGQFDIEWEMVRAADEVGDAV